VDNRPAPDFIFGAGSSSLGTKATKNGINSLVAVVGGKKGRIRTTGGGGGGGGRKVLGAR